MASVVRVAIQYPDRAALVLLYSGLEGFEPYLQGLGFRMVSGFRVLGFQGLRDLGLGLGTLSHIFDPQAGVLCLVA